MSAHFRRLLAIFVLICNTYLNGQAVTYDEIGNPLIFGSKSFEWCGRQLERITDGDNTYVYAYNTDGGRVSKTVNGVKTEYFYNGSILAGQKTGDETLIFMYDNNGDAFGFIYNGEEYYYIKNVQNDIVAIADKNGDIVVNYYYDAWGNVTQITGNTALAQTNPLRYRSYYYDSETGYYHLKSRYYSPEVGRFLNADGYLAVIKNGDVAVGEGDDEKLGLVSHAVSEGDPVSFRMEVMEDGLKEALKLVQKAEKTVVVLGSNPVINSKEEIDRTTLALPPAQQHLADEVLKANPDAVIVLVTNYPYSIVDLNANAKAILYTASGSQELGTGIGAVLSGRVNPAARLPMTWYQADEDLPDINDYDIIKGKRTYQYFDGKVLYPFGYGLSYTGFRYEEMQTEEKEDEIIVRLSVTSTGDVKGDEVVQLYVHKEDSRVVRPIRQLKDFVRVKDLAPGETRTVTLSVKKEELRYFDVISGQMLLEDGGYLLEAGASSVDIRQKQEILLKGQKAGVRDPFAATEAIRYDDYENCFIHKGTFGHAEHGETCLIPGRPGEAPDEVKSTPDGKVKGELVYRDFLFKKQAVKFSFTACVLEEARIRVLSEDENHKTVLVDQILALLGTKSFRNYEAVLEGQIPEISMAKTITIQLMGKVKLKEFRFL